MFRARRCVEILVCLLSISCGRPAPTRDPVYVAAASHANLPLLGVEVAAVGMGFLVGEDPGSVPLGSLSFLDGVFNRLFSSCATVRTDMATGEIQVQFAAGGCGIPDTTVRVQGGLTVRSMGMGGTNTNALSFRDFSVVGSPALNGGMTLRFINGSTIEGTFTGLTVGTGAGTAPRIDGTVQVVSSRLHTIVQLTTNGTVTLGGQTYSLTTRNLERHLSIDCYPEAGTATLQVPGPNGMGMVEATFEFVDDQFSLDSDDSGMVWLTMNGRKEPTQLPTRLCVGL